MVVNKIKYNHRINTRTKKQVIVIHGTGGGSVDGCISSFEPSGVSVPFVIDRSGSIFQLYDESFDHWHCGSNFRGLSKRSIGIELVNWNYLNEKDGYYYSWTNKFIPKEEVVLASNNWRGFKSFHNVTKKQHEALCYLLKFLCEKHDIKKDLIRDFHPEIIKKEEWSGICFHSSFHPTKTDFYPFVIDKIKI